MNKLLDSRLRLHEKLVKIMKTTSNPVNSVFFKPQSNVRLTYPCIVYTRNQSSSVYADNLKYFSKDNFRLTVIDRDADSTIVSKILEDIPTSVKNDEFVSDGLYHYIINISTGV